MNLFSYSSRFYARAFAALAMIALVIGVFPMSASAQAAPTCTIEISSSDEAFVVQKGGEAEVLFPTHTGWTASIPGASWIWGTNPVAIGSDNETQTFREEFGFVGTVTSATLQVASDNGHEAALNGGTSHDFGSSFNNLQSYDVTADIVQGDNTLEIDVTNEGLVSTIEDQAGNPAGVLYKLTIQGTPTTDENCRVDVGFDVCANIDDQQFVVPDGLEEDDGDCVTPEVPQEADVCDMGDNLLQNASFEDPVVTANGGQYEIFPAAITNWLVSLSDGVELWRGVVVAPIAPSEGQQNVELDGNDATRITQTVTTTPGATYQLRFDFAARTQNAADNHLEVMVDGVSFFNQTSDNTAWVTHSGTFVADDSTDISFTDLGTPQDGGGTGTLLDNTVLCLVSNPDDDDDDDVTLYRIQGYVWHDDNNNGVWDGIEDEEEGNEEDTLAGWIIRITNGIDTFETTTDGEGYYFFDVPEGTWVVTEEVQNDWERTTQESHTVTVPAESDEENPPFEVINEFSLLDSVVDFIIPTAHAQVPRPLVYGDYNFGNDEERSGGGGGGNRAGDRDTDDSDDDTPDGEVLGDSDSATPTVLGDQVSAVPAGAADTGAGGTSRTLEFFQFAPVALVGRTRKHG